MEINLILKSPSTIHLFKIYIYACVYIYDIYIHIYSDYIVLNKTMLIISVFSFTFYISF